MTAAPPPLPRRTKFAAILLMVIAAAVGIYAAQEALLLTHPAALADAPVPAYGGLDPESARKFNHILLATLAGMRDSRAFLLVALAIASALTFVAAGRLLRPAGVSRESVRKLLAGSALAAAVLRTIDGAQMAVAYRRAFGAVAEAFVRIAVPPGSPPPAGLQDLIAPLMAAVVMGWTIVLVGIFLLTAQHFRSKAVREFVAASDSRDIDR